MYYPLYNNPFYYPSSAYMQNMCSFGHVQDIAANTPNSQYNTQDFRDSNFTRSENYNTNNILNNDLFSLNGDRLEVFGISINIDDLIILIMLFFMFKEKQIDYSIIIILALILFDQS